MIGHEVPCLESELEKIASHFVNAKVVAEIDLKLISSAEYVDVCWKSRELPIAQYRSTPTQKPASAFGSRERRRPHSAESRVPGLGALLPRIGPLRLRDAGLGLVGDAVDAAASARVEGEIPPGLGDAGNRTSSLITRPQEHVRVARRYDPAPTER